MPITQYSDVFADLMSDALKMIAYGETASDIANLLCQRAETVACGSICSLLSVDRSARLRTLAAPSLPTNYTEAIHGLQAGPSVGSCGTAAYRGEPVVVTSIATDPLWADYKQLVLPLGLQACWSTPIFSRDRKVIGTFAFYFREQRGPTKLERQIVERCTDLCSIVLENDQLRQQMFDLAFLDALTGLPNRASFDKRTRALIEHSNIPFALVLADLDYLKSVNDMLGHAAGDLLIREASRCIRSINKPNIEAFRLGGDEFALLIVHCDSREMMTDVAKLLIHEVKGSVSEYDGSALSPSMTAGGALRDPDMTDFSALFQNADYALYHAKENSRGGFVAFQPGMRTAMACRRQVIEDVTTALGDGRLVAHYQPIVRLDTGEIVGVEALARILTKEGAIKSAGEFHQAFSDSRLSSAVTLAMLDRVVDDLRSWIDAGIPPQHIGFNVNTADFQRGDLEAQLSSAFARANVPMKHLILEVNEAVLMKDDVARKVKSLRSKGTLVALDDFGTGHASLTHLLNFPVDIIKIDKSFVDRIVEDKNSVAIVQALLDIAARLKMRVVAEGIETTAQTELLHAMGCVLGQGYQFGKPVPNFVMEDLLQRFGQRQRQEGQARRALAGR